MSVQLGNYYCHFTRRRIRALIKHHHYLHRIPIRNYKFAATLHKPGGLFGDYGRVVAVILFSNATARWHIPLWELSRMVVLENHPDITLTQFMAAACAEIRRQKLTDIVISYADSTVGHHGGIYQAASWYYSGRREPAMDGIILPDGRMVPGRTCNARWGTRSPAKLSRMLNVDIKPHFDNGKHLYWKPITKKGERIATELGLEKLPYPKPEKEKTSIRQPRKLDKPFPTNGR